MSISYRYQATSNYLLLAVLSLLILLAPSAFSQADTTTNSTSLTQVQQIEQLKTLVEKYQNMQLAITQPATSSVITTKLAGTNIGIWNKKSINFNMSYDVTATDSDIYTLDYTDWGKDDNISILNGANEYTDGTYKSLLQTSAEKITTLINGQSVISYKVTKGTTKRFNLKVTYTPVSEGLHRMILRSVPYVINPAGSAEYIHKIGYSTYPIMWRASGY